jgi:hypothetical protein
MDTQSLINIFVAIAGFFGGWVINSLTKSITRIEDRLQEIPSKFIAKDDYHRDIDEIKIMLKSIFDKLDHKADK